MGKKLGRSAIDELGNTYGLLTVIARGEKHYANALWVCVCRCGGRRVAIGTQLRNGNTKSCGCLSEYNLVGKKYGKLKVLKKSTISDRKHQSFWLCRCDCGKRVVKMGSKMMSGHTKSCGCLRIMPKGGRSILKTGYIDIFAP